MEEQDAARQRVLCHRCLQPVPVKAVRCPNCGDPIKKTANIRLMLGIFGLVVLLILAVVSFRLMQQSRPAVDNTPAPEGKPALGQ